MRIYCSPRSIRPARHFLYRNNGDRTFTDVTEAAGVGRSDGRGLGVVAADLNGDGRIDLYVANDMCPNFVFLNQGDGTFEDVTESSGAGYGPNGLIRAGMGVDAEDVNGDGLPDLLVTNFWNEAIALFINLGDGLFEDRTRTSGLFHDSVLWVGWGCALATSTTTAGPIASSPTATSTTTSSSWDRHPLCRAGPAASQPDGRTVRAGDPRGGTLLRRRPRRAGGWPSATSTTTATSTSWSTTRTVRRPCSATTPRRPTTGSVSAWRGSAPIATPSGHASRSKRAGRTIFASARGERAWHPPTTPGS